MWKPIAGRKDRNITISSGCSESVIWKHRHCCFENQTGFRGWGVGSLPTHKRRLPSGVGSLDLLWKTRLLGRTPSKQGRRLGQEIRGGEQPHWFSKTSWLKKKKKKQPPNHECYKSHIFWLIFPPSTILPFFVSRWCGVAVWWFVPFDNFGLVLGTVLITSHWCYFGWKWMSGGWLTCLPSPTLPPQTHKNSLFIYTED